MEGRALIPLFTISPCRKPQMKTSPITVPSKLPMEHIESGKRKMAPRKNCQVWNIRLSNYFGYRWEILCALRDVLKCKNWMLLPTYTLQKGSVSLERLAICWHSQTILIARKDRKWIQWKNVKCGRSRRHQFNHVTSFSYNFLWNRQNKVWL